jgi:hypothetical protein
MLVGKNTIAKASFPTVKRFFPKPISKVNWLFGSPKFKNLTLKLQSIKFSMVEMYLSYCLKILRINLPPA